MKLLRRVLVFCIGIFLVACGVSISISSNLGITPVNSVPYLLSEIYQVDMGYTTIGFYILLIISQVLLLGREFKLTSLLQIVGAILFGMFVSCTNRWLSFLPVPHVYWMQLLYCAVSVVVIGIGLFLYLAPNIMSMPGEGVMQALVYRFKLQNHRAKLLFDCSMVIITILLSLAILHAVVGVREGTVMAALGIGFSLKYAEKFLKQPISKFLS